MLPPVNHALLLERHHICSMPEAALGAADAGEPGAEPDGNEKPYGVSSTEQLARLLEAFGRSMESPSGKVTGALFMKRYDSLAAGMLYAWTHHGAAWNGLRTEMHVEIKGQTLQFDVPSPRRNQVPVSTLDVLDQLLREWVSPVLQQTARLTGVREANLWSNLSYLLAYWEREWLLNTSPDSAIHHRVAEAFRLLREPGRPEWFLGRRVSPLANTFRQVANPYDSERPIRIRSRCCTSFRLPGENRACYTCPLLCEEDRMAKVAAAYGKRKG